MKKNLCYWLCLIFASVSSSMALPNPDNSNKKDTVLITNVIVIDIHTGNQSTQNILIQDGLITEIRPYNSSTTNTPLPEKTTVIDASGQYAIPGLWDMHVHLTLEPTLKDYISSLLIANGVTSVRDMGGALDEVLAFRHAAKGTLAPRIWIAGPLFDGKPHSFRGFSHGKPAMSLEVDSTEAAIHWVDTLAKRGVDLIKPYGMLHPKAFAAMVQRADKHNLPVAGHLPVRMTAKQATQIGMDGFEHLGFMIVDCATNAENLVAETAALVDTLADKKSMLPFNQKYNSTVIAKALATQDPQRCEALIQRFVDNNIWVDPTLITSTLLHFYKRTSWLNTANYLPKKAKQVWQLKVDGFTAAMNNPNHAASLHEYTDWTINRVQQMHQAGMKLLAGTDTPTGTRIPGFSLHDELTALVTLGGLSPLAALQAATLHPAEFFNIDKELGSIEQGKLADLVLLTANPLVDINNSRKISAVISRGKLLRREQLNGLLSNVSGQSSESASE